MLGTKVIETVKATVPLLQESGELLIRHFYERMFKHNPEVQVLFNPTNQVLGIQQKALAEVICTYAENIDNLDALNDTVELIANKHASLQIKPQHYPIVGENLLESIKEVLGDVATDDVIYAWKQAYSFIANILIEREKQIYSEQQNTLGGWQGFKKFKVIKKVTESDIITSFYLIPEDGSPIPTFKPGQYITVRMPSPIESTTMRNYSLSNKPNQEYFRISVKREDGMNGCPMGYVSNMLHSQIEQGQSIEVAPPCGEFFLDLKVKRKRPLVLLAGGIGVTPILSILFSALETMPEQDIIFIQASLHENNQAFRKTIDELSEKYSNFFRHYRYSESAPKGITRKITDHISEGFIDTTLIESLVGSTDADVYFCGPKPFMINIYRDLLAWGVPSEQIHFEFFGPQQEIKNVKIV